MQGRLEAVPREIRDIIASFLEPCDEYTFSCYERGSIPSVLKLLGLGAAKYVNMVQWMLDRGCFALTVLRYVIKEGNAGCLCLMPRDALVGHLNEYIRASAIHGHISMLLELCTGYGPFEISRQEVATFLIKKGHVSKVMTLRDIPEGAGKEIYEACRWTLITDQDNIRPADSLSRLLLGSGPLSWNEVFAIVYHNRTDIIDTILGCNPEGTFSIYTHSGHSLTMHSRRDVLRRLIVHHRDITDRYLSIFADSIRQGIIMVGLVAAIRALDTPISRRLLSMIGH